MGSYFFKAHKTKTRKACNSLKAKLYASTVKSF